MLMTRISRKIKTDKRTKKRIKVDVLATKVILQYDNLTLNLPTVEAKRIAMSIQKAVDIQATRRSDTVASTSHFSKQVLIQPEVEKLPVLTTLEKRLEVCRYIYRIIKDKHQEIPKYRKTKIVAHSINTCDSGLGSALAHCHHKGRSKFSQRICIKQKYLLNPKQDTDFNSLVDSFANTMAHEIGHLMIKSCRHCNKWRMTYLKFHEAIKKSISNGEFEKNLPENLKEF